MSNEVITKQMPASRIQLRCGNEWAQFSTRLDRMAFREILDHLSDLSYRRGALKECKIPELSPCDKEKIADIERLYVHIRDTYFERFVT